MNLDHLKKQVEQIKTTYDPSGQSIQNAYDPLGTLNDRVEMPMQLGVPQMMNQNLAPNMQLLPP